MRTAFGPKRKIPVAAGRKASYPATVCPTLLRCRVAEDPAQPLNTFRLKECRAISGDTLDAAVSLPLGVSVRRRIKLKGFRAPAMRGRHSERAVAAKEALQTAIQTAKLSLLNQGLHEDEAGNLTGTVLFNGEKLTGEEVLGLNQMTPQGYAEDQRNARRRDSADG